MANLFQIKTKPMQIEHADRFIEEEFVAVGYPLIPNMEGLSYSELRHSIMENYNLEGHEAGNLLGCLNIFVNEMQEGDFILIKHESFIYIGRLHSYQYDESKGYLRHFRKVTWLGGYLEAEFDHDVLSFVNNRSMTTQYKFSLERANLPGTSNLCSEISQFDLKVLKKESLLVLKEYLNCDSPKLRIRAAGIILNLK